MLFSLLVSSCLILLVNAVRYAPQVDIEGGKIRGVLANLTTGHVVRKYLGIPFAKSERFKAPTSDDTTWSGVKDMISLGKECPQLPADYGLQLLRKSEDISEDCLNLNVFVPHKSNSSPFPVMVWVHGGAYKFGSNRIYDGSYISALGDVIVVTINYRITMFGFLTTGENGDLKGNYGMFDQIQALKWVKKNIEGFGGNPNNVTIFGESAGGSSVSLLMLSPLTKGLFQNVIMQSGAAAAKWAADYYHEAKMTAVLFGKHVGCTDMKAIAECLKTKSLKQILNASALMTDSRFSPVIDGYFLPDAPSVLLQKGKFEKLAVMVGVTDDDGSTATNALSGTSVGMDVVNGIKRDIFTAALKSKKFHVILNQKSPLPSAMIYRYTDWNNVSDPYRNRRMFMDMMTDTMFLAPAIQCANAFVNYSLTTYFYQLQYRSRYGLSGKPVPSWLRAYHGSDVPFMFGLYLNVSTHLLSTKDANFSRDIIRMWSNFAKTGNPNQPQKIQITWPQYDSNNQLYIALKPNMAIDAKPRAEYVAFWNDFIPEALRSLPKPKPCNVPSDGNKIAIDIAVISSVLFASILLGMGYII